MKTKFKSTIRNKCRSCGVVSAVATVLQFGALAGYAQTGQYLFTGSETTITLNAGIYDITAYGAQGGADYQSGGGLGAEMEALDFPFQRQRHSPFWLAAAQSSPIITAPAAGEAAVLLSTAAHH